MNISRISNHKEACASSQTLKQFDLASPKGEKKGRPHQTLYVRKFDDDLYSVRDGDLKLVTKKKNSVKELYNLQDDLGEENDLAETFPEKVKRLDSLRQNWDAQLIDPIFLGLIHTERWQKRLKENP